MKRTFWYPQGFLQNRQFPYDLTDSRLSLMSLIRQISVAALACASLSAVGGGTVIGWGGNEVGQISFGGQQAKAIAAGCRDSLLLRDDGTVAGYGAWGWWWIGDPPVTIPPLLDRVVAVAAGCYQSLALRDDGTLVAWGLNNGGGTDVPPDLTKVVQIATYGAIYPSSLLALTADGRVVAWGAGAAAVPSGLSNIVAVSVGSGGLALKADGTVVGWGWGVDTSRKLELLTNVVAISAGCDDLLALKADGTVIGIPEWDWYSLPAGLSNVVKIAASQGNDHHLDLALKADGTVVGWGYNFYGNGSAGPFVPDSVSNAVAIASGYNHTLALIGDFSADGRPSVEVPPMSRSCLAAGDTYFRVEATGAFPLRYQWEFNGQPIPGETNAVLALYSVKLEQAGLYQVIVSNSFGTATASAELRVMPLGITAQPQDVVTFAGDTAVMSVGALGFDLHYQWRKDGVDIAGATNSDLRLANLQLSQSGAYSVVVSNSLAMVVSQPAALMVLPVLITVPPMNQVAFRHGPASFAVTALGSGPLQYQWRFNGADLPAATASRLNLSGLEGTNAGRYEVMVTSSYGSVLSDEASLLVTPVASWGDLGESTVPGSLTNVKAIAAGMFHELALTADGTVVAWGGNDQGQINLPPGLTNIVAIASGSYAVQSQALKEDGTLICWGTNIDPPALPPPGLSNVVGMSSGEIHAVAVTSHGQVVSWGYGANGVTQVPPGLSNVVAVAAGEAHGLALRADGTVVSWPPVLDAGLSNVVAVAAGSIHNMALRGDGTVVAWGDNWAGQTNVPPEATNVVAIATGEFHSMALRNDGSVIAWGHNFNGQSTTPPELTNVVAIAAGGGHSLALIGDGPPVTHVSVSTHWTPAGLAVTVPTRSGRVYALEYTTSLEQPDWKLLPLVAGDGTVRLLSDPSPSDLQRFYRVRSW